MTKRGLTHFLFTFICAVFALACVLAPGPAKADSVTYIERAWSGTAVTATETTRNDVTVFPKSKEIAPGWYYVNRNVTIDGRVSLQGDTQIILGDGYTLDVKGLYIPTGYTLTIYGQTAGTGKINSHPSGGAAIGAYGDNHPGGNIVIHGGTITATGASHCAGIGSNDGNGTTAPITIYGGTITAEGGSDGAAIGGGRNCNGGTITIYGGDITANGPTDSDTCENGAGIGGGDRGNGGTIAIYGGTITAYSRDGAGIGGGDDGEGGTITIYGGTITSTKVNQGYGARIGGGSDAAPGTIAIHGGTITTVGGKGAGIGGGRKNKSDGTVTIDGGVISASGNYGIGSGESGSDVAVTLGYTDAAQNSISINSSSYNGTVTLENDFQNTSGKYLAGSTPDKGKLGGSAVVYWDSMSWADLQAMIDSAAEGDIIALENDVIAKAGNTLILIAEGKNITLDLNGYTLDRNAEALGVTSQVIRVEGSLTITDSSSGKTGRITGSYWGSGVAICGGSVTLNSGSISGNKNTANGGGGGVRVREGGSFTMNGGAIKDNLATAGGGVFVDADCRFTLNGGVIENNDAVLRDGNLLEEDITIPSVGGGVMAAGEFTMTGGTIKENSSFGGETSAGLVSGGGVFVIQTSFRMTGGSIEGNSGNGAGGGLMIMGGTTTMSGGRIMNNMTYSLDAAGVEIGGGTFRMTGGEISNNVALVGESAATSHGTVFGGGVCVRRDTIFEVSGSPKVRNNTISVIGMEGLINVDVLVASDAYMTVTGPFTSGADLSVFPGRVGSEVTKGLSENGGSDPLNYLKCNVGDPDNPLAIQINANGEAVIGPRAVVTYKANGGSGADVKDNAVRNMEGYYLQDNPFTPPEGKAFYNWQIGEQTYWPGDAYSPAGNTDVLAVWGSDQYFTVSFGTGHEGAGGSMHAIKIEKTGDTESYNLPDCGFTAPAGYVFDGWRIGDTAETKAPGETITLTGDVTITAVWKFILGDWAELQTQINTAESNAVIQLTKDYMALGDDTALVIPDGKSLTLDLNGHTIDRNANYDEYVFDPVIYVYGSLIIKDSSSGEIGKITGGTDSGIRVGRSKNGVDDPGYLTLQSGSITENIDGGVFVSRGRFTMNDGVISYNTGSSGAGVYVAGNQDGECFTMTGGKIVHNSFRNGGGVYLTSTSGTMSGGEISDNHARADGGGIYLFRSDFSMSGGKIENNTADNNGGGIFTRFYGTDQNDDFNLRITGGRISGNKASTYGGGIYTRFNTQISGGIITGNTAGNVESTGSGIYQENHSQIELSGTPVITGNAAGNGKADNLTLNDEKVSITGALTNDAIVGVNVWVDSQDLVPDGDGYVVFTTGLNGKGGAANFSSDNGTSAVSLTGDGEARLGWTARAAAPAFSPESCSITEAQDVEITCETEGSVIHYTTDGTDPTADSAEYSGPIHVDATTTIKAIAVANEMANSEIAEATYTMKTVTPAFSPEPGTYEGAQNVTISCATEGATIYYTTDIFTDPLEDGIEYTGAIPVTASVTIKAAAVKDGIEPSDTALATYLLNAVYTLEATAPEFSPVRVGYAQPAAQPLTIVSSGNTVTTISSVALSGEGESAFILNKTTGATIAAGTTDDTTYTIRPAAGLAVGTYTATVTVVYDNDETAQAEVSFTVDDLEPCEVVISVQKTLSGRVWTTDDGFEFTLVPEGEAPAPETRTETVTIDSADHTEAFEPITITAPGTYSWTVCETHRGETIDGVQYADEEKTVTVTVTADGTGKLAADDGSSLTPAVAFTNTFVGYSVTFRVVNGSWDDGTATDRTITVGYNQTIPVDDIPDVGESPDEGYMANGSWDTEPPLETPVTQNATYTYTYYPSFGTADFTLPASTHTIEDQAFEGVAATVVEIPANCTRIGDRAFKNCAQLTMIRIPADCELGTDVFDGCTKVYIFGTAGSPAEDYCNDPDHSNCEFVAEMQD